MTGQVGPRGLAILVLAAITGILLAILGWSQRGTGLIAPSVGGLSGASAPAAPTQAARPATPTPTPTSRASATPSSGRTPSPSAPQAAPSAQPSPTASTGPLLASEWYAQYAYLVWPGTPSPPAREAMSGLTISVARQAGGISVRAGFTGQPLPTTRFYPGGAKVYVLETSLGDDSGYEDYNLGDDGLVVTTAQGQIVS
jgi:hypothetical protein